MIQMMFLNGLMNISVMRNCPLAERLCVKLWELGLAQAALLPKIPSARSLSD